MFPTRSDQVRIFISAGEPSGDLHAARLMAEIRLRIPNVVFEGIGGPAMELQGLHSLASLKDLAVSGFWEVAKRYGFFRALLDRCADVIRRTRPSIFIPVDYPGFNMRLADHARRADVPVAYYIAPQLWAWGRDRGRRLAEVVNRLLVVFPFEREFFAQFGIDTVHVGHPLLDDEAFSPPLSHDGSQLVVMPGSRRQELHRHLSLLADTVKRLRTLEPSLSVICPRPGFLPDEAYRLLADCDVKIVDDARQAMRTSAAGLIKAGTSTLEAALLGLPFSTFYRTSWLSYRMSKRLVQVDSVTMMNLLLNERIIHEYIQDDATPERLAQEARRLLHDEERRAELRAASDDVRELLGGPGASARAADIIADMVL